MSAEKVVIDYDLLDGVRTSIRTIITALKDAPENAHDAAGAIDRPFEQPQLQALAGDFRGEWESRREDLIISLEDVSGYISDVIDSYYGLDRWF
ncbi:hypothetical protein ACTJI8_15870 [Microbacterium sp. 22303]|uniref:hypothetical protein n=1 Tax=Microbacterium sp. 22303 TaxID=3453905 RepID=UPI003F859A89